MKNTLLAVIVSLLVLHAQAQNKQWLRNMDSTVSRVYNLYYGETPDVFYSLVWHMDFRGVINNNLSYYRINRFDKDTLTRSVKLININQSTGVFNTLMYERTNLNAIMFVRDFVMDTATHYIVYFNDTLKVDSFNIESRIPIGSGYCYLKQNDSLIIIHGDDFFHGGNVYVLFTDSQGTYLSHKSIHDGSVKPGPVFNYWIDMTPYNLIADGKGGYIVVGERDSSGTNIKKHMFGLSAQGNKTWEYFEPMDGNSFLSGAKLMPDGTILTWGMQWERMYIGRFTNTGVPIWQKMYYPGGIEGLGTGAMVIDLQIIDDHMYVVGTSADNFLGTSPHTIIGVLMKLTLTGEVVWAEGFGNYYGNNILQNMLFLPPNKFMLGGFCIDSTLTPVHGVSWYVSTDTAANQELPWCKLLPVHTLDYTSLKNLENPECNNCIHIYPNPATNGVLHIETAPEYLDAAHIILYTMTGVPVYKQVILQHRESINTTQLPPGNYLLWFKSNKGRTSKKVVIR